MGMDANELRARLNKKLQEAGVDLKSTGTNLALELGQQIQAAVEQARESLIEQACQLLAEIEPSAPAAAASAPVAAPPTEAFSRLLESVETIESGASQVEILKSLLACSQSFCPRVALFIVKGEKGIGWLASGFGTKPPFTDEGIKKVWVPLSRDTLFREVYDQGLTYYGRGKADGDNLKFFEKLGGFIPGEVISVPLRIKGKVVAILYGDGGSEVGDIPAHDAIATLVQVAAMSIKLIPSKIRTEDSTEQSGRFARTAESGKFQAQSAGPTAPAAPAPAVAAPSVAAPPAAPAARAAPPGVAPEDQKLHDDAKRFARLLVSEIKLYNEAKVAVGKRNNDLYERLKEDIERSRQMYNQRFPAKVTSTTNYFFEELVKQLADGDRAALGV